MINFKVEFALLPETNNSKLACFWMMYVFPTHIQTVPNRKMLVDPIHGLGKSKIMTQSHVKMDVRLPSV